MLNRLQVSGGKWGPPEKRNAGEKDAEKIFFKLFIFQCGIYARKYIFWYFFLYGRGETDMNRANFVVFGFLFFLDYVGWRTAS